MSELLWSARDTVEWETPAAVAMSWMETCLRAVELLASCVIHLQEIGS
jgi:hypothetical protein